MLKCVDVQYLSVLSKVNLDIESQKITCIVGESGGGKTTLLRLFAKLISPSEGKIFYHGDDIATIDSVAYRQKVVMLSQKPMMFLGSVKDNLIKGLQYHGKSLDDDVLIGFLQRVRLQKSLADSVSNLSGGESQRLALARVMTLDADVILLDEPSSALDDDTERFVIEEIVRFVKEQKKTLVMVTHSKTIAEKYADVTFTFTNGAITGCVNHG